jgi:hypothetical protein
LKKKLDLVLLVSFLKEHSKEQQVYIFLLSFDLFAFCSFVFFSYCFFVLFVSFIVAIKRLKTQHLEQTVWLEFLREVEILRKLAKEQHENIVAIVGMSTIPPNMAIVLVFYPLGGKCKERDEK